MTAQWHGHRMVAMAAQTDCAPCVSRRRFGRRVGPARLVAELQEQQMLRDVNGFRRLMVRSHDSVTIIFADIAGFTAFSATVTPGFLVRQRPRLRSDAGRTGTHTPPSAPRALMQRAGTGRELEPHLYEL